MHSYATSISSLSGQSRQRRWLHAGRLAGVVALATVLPTAAVPLLPGGNTALSGTTSAGTVIRDNLLPFVIRNSSKQELISGNVQDRVVRVAATGDLVFMPRLRDVTATTAGAGFSFVSIKVTGYDDTTTDVEWKSDGSGDVGPSSASRDISGDEVTFFYEYGSLVPKDESRFPLIETNAPAYHLDGRITITASKFLVGTYSTTIQNTAAPTRLQVYPGGVIQAAIDAASPGETVLVHPGTYTESISLRSGIDVKGAGAGLVTLRAPADPAVAISNCTDTEFSGFTVMPATSAAFIGIFANGGSPLVKNNIITGFSQRGIHLTNGCNAIVCGNRVLDNGDSGNTTLDYGIICLKSNPLIANNLISGNECGCYIAWHESDGAQFINNTAVNNSSDGFWCYQSNPVVKNNIVTGNSAGISASHANATPILSYNNSWGNTWLNYNAQATGVLTIGPGSISADPLFDPTAPDDYRLLVTSPCRDTGDPAFIYNDLDGSRNDMGWTGGPCASPDVSAAPFGGFLWTSVGNIPANYIPSSGLATVPAGDATALQIPAWDHAPFGSKPYLFGVFGSGVSPSYYHIEYKLAGAPEGDFTPLDHPLSKVRYTITPTGITPSVQSVGPYFFSDGLPYYQVTNNGGTIYWAHDTLKLILNSHQLPDGTYNFRLKAFTGTLSAINLTGPANGLTLTINNQWPTVEIISIARASGALLTECGIVSLTGPQENLRFRITATHPDGFLDDYSLVALVGRNRYAGQIAGDDHGTNHAGQASWSGVTDTPFDTLPAMTAAPPTLSPWESCAYQFRLSAWARTTNGYGRLYYRPFFWNVALNLNGADLDGDGDVDADDLNRFAEAYGSSNN